MNIQKTAVSDYPYISYVVPADEIINLVKHEKITTKYRRYGMHVAKVINAHIGIYDDVDCTLISALLNVKKTELRTMLDEALVELKEQIDNYIHCYGNGFDSYERMADELGDYCDKVRLIAYVLDSNLTAQ